LDPSSPPSVRRSLSAAQSPLPTRSGPARPDVVFCSSVTQANFDIPVATPAGPTNISIDSVTNALTIQKPVVSVAPGLFGVDGVALGNVLTYANGSATPVVTNTFTFPIAPAPIDVGTGSTQVYLVLYGTGIRNHVNPVTATIGSTAVTAAYAGAQNVYVGEDQINILLPQTLAGAGTVTVNLSVDGMLTNRLRIAIQ
jgi:uncharacterized protein (TIGR03437 family)